MKAFKALCDGKNGNTLLVPKDRSFFLRPTLNFTGPCNSKNINIKVQEFISLNINYFFISSNIVVNNGLII